MLDIGTISREINRDLDSEFKSNDIAIKQLAEYTEKVEDKLIDILRQNLITFFRDSIPDIKVSEDYISTSTYTKLFIDSDQFDLCIDKRDIRRPQILAVTLLAKTPEPGKVEPDTSLFSIEGCGRYSSVEILIDPRLGHYADQVARIVETVVATVYSWLLEFIRIKFADLKNDLGKVLYSYLRRIFGAMLKPDLVENIWLVIIDKDEDKGCYILDSNAAETAITILTKREQETAISPARLFAEFIATVLPYESTHSRRAISEGVCVDIDLRTSNYLENRHAGAVRVACG